MHLQDKVNKGEGPKTLNTSTFHVEKYILKKLENVSIKRQFSNEFKYNAQIIYNKKKSLSKQKVRS